MGLGHTTYVTLRIIAIPYCVILINYFIFIYTFFYTLARHIMLPQAVTNIQIKKNVAANACS